MRDLISGGTKGGMACIKYLTCKILIILFFLYVLHFFFSELLQWSGEACNFNISCKGKWDFVEKKKKKKKKKRETFSSTVYMNIDNYYFMPFGSFAWHCKK